VVARADQVHRALEERARGLDPLSDELPLFARRDPAVPQPGGSPAVPAGADNAAPQPGDSPVVPAGATNTPAGATNAVPQPGGSPAVPAGANKALAALAAIEPDALSPREAQDALYRLKSLLAETETDAVAAVQDTVVSS
jgi:DNA mismatch repair protein MutS